MWICPKCKKEFKAPSQYHSCYSRKVEDHLAGKPESIQKLINEILDYCGAFKDCEINGVKTGILLKCKANFLSVYPTSKQVTLEFQLPYFTDEFPIAFSKRISKNRVFCKVKIQTSEEFDDQIKQWIKDSYQLISGNALM